MCEMRDLLVLVLLVLCSISDVRQRGVYTWVLVSMSFLLAAFCLVCRRQDVLDVLGGISVGCVFLLISRLSSEAVGYADSWLILLLGGYLGVQDIMILLTIAFMLAGVFGLVGIAFRRLKRASTVPFIPFLTVAYIGVILL